MLLERSKKTKQAAISNDETANAITNTNEPVAITASLHASLEIIKFLVDDPDNISTAYTRELCKILANMSVDHLVGVGDDVQTDENDVINEEENAQLFVHLMKLKKGVEEVEMMLMDKTALRYLSKLADTLQLVETYDSISEDEQEEEDDE